MAYQLNYDLDQFLALKTFHYSLSDCYNNFISLRYSIKIFLHNGYWRNL